MVLLCLKKNGVVFSRKGGRVGKGCKSVQMERTVCSSLCPHSCILPKNAATFLAVVHPTNIRQKHMPTWRNRCRRKSLLQKRGVAIRSRKYTITEGFVDFRHVFHVHEVLCWQARDEWALWI